MLCLSCREPLADRDAVWGDERLAYRVHAQCRQQVAGRRIKAVHIENERRGDTILCTSCFCASEGIDGSQLSSYTNQKPFTALTEPHRCASCRRVAA